MNTTEHSGKGLIISLAALAIAAVGAFIQPHFSQAEPPSPSEGEEGEQRLPGTEQLAVIDRIVDGSLAVVLIGHEEREIHVRLAALPPQARPGSWLRAQHVQSADGTAVWRFTDEPEATQAAWERVSERRRLLKASRTARRGLSEDGPAAAAAGASLQSGPAPPPSPPGRP